MTIPAGHFYEILPDGRWHFRFDHHLIDDFNSCDRYFKYRHMPHGNGKPSTVLTTEAGLTYSIKNEFVWQPKSTQNIFKREVGSWWSHVMEMFYTEMSHGTLPPSTMILKFAADAWLTTNMNRFANDQFEAKKYDQFKGAEGAAIMALEYYDRFAALDFRQWRVVSAEKGFGLRDEVYIGETTGSQGVVVHYMGKPDLTVIDYASREFGPLDFKTKDYLPGNINSLFKPHPQTTGYIVSCNDILQQIRDNATSELKSAIANIKPTSRCFIRACARLRPTEKPRDGVVKPRFTTVFVNYSQDELTEWKQSIIAKATRLRYAIEHDEFIPRESQCNGMHNTGCAFRRVCSVPRASRDMVLHADFVQVAPWVPYEVEED